MSRVQRPPPGKSEGKLIICSRRRQCEVTDATHAASEDVGRLCSCTYSLLDSLGPRLRSVLVRNRGRCVFARSHAGFQGIHYLYRKVSSFHQWFDCSAKYLSIPCRRRCLSPGYAVPLRWQEPGLRVSIPATSCGLPRPHQSATTRQESRVGFGTYRCWHSWAAIPVTLAEDGCETTLTWKKKLSRDYTTSIRASHSADSTASSNL